MLEKSLLEELLILEKSISNIAFYSTIESANKKIRLLNENFLNISLYLQNLIFEYMKKNDYYKIDNVDKKTINDSLSKIKTA